ncbi:MAG TPA: peptidoglycan-associated lipoprotein Pal [Gemmatimonadaceae bacterium]|jgi:peptidoglycan-associated lipoprotein
MLRTRIAAGGITALLIAGPALAQQPRRGTVEIGLFGQYTEFDDRFRLDNAIGIGGRLGVFLTPRWALEGDAGWAKTSDDGQPFVLGASPRGGDYNFTPLYFRVAYNIPVGSRSGVILGAHVVRLDYENTYEVGYGGLLGLRAGITPSLALRLDAIGDWNQTDTPTPDDPDGGSDITLTGRAGLSLMLRTSRPTPPPPPPPVVAEPEPAPAPPPPPPPPPPAPEPEPDRTAEVRSTMTQMIHFDFDKSDLRAEAQSTLDAKIPLFQANPEMRIRISGHADERGSDEYNVALGQRRASAAKQYLVQHGISEDRIEIVSYGEERPTCTEQNESCYQQNRRDEFEIIAGGPTFKMP